MHDLSARHIEDAYQKLLADGLDPRTVRLVHCVLSGACKYAVRSERIHRNVAALVVLPAVTKREVTPPEIDTVRQLLELAETKNHPLFPFLFVLTYTGTRKGELWGLKWRHVDPGTRTRPCGGSRGQDAPTRQARLYAIQAA